MELELPAREETLKSFLETLEFHEGMGVDKITSVCYGGDFNTAPPEIILYRFGSAIAATYVDQAWQDPGNQHDAVGYWMLRAITSANKPISISEATILGSIRGTISPTIENTMQTFADVGLIQIIDGPEKKYAARDLSPFTIKYKKPWSPGEGDIIGGEREIL